MKPFWKSLLLSILTVTMLPILGTAQTDLDTLGRPSAGASFPIEHGQINLSNGNVHIEIPIINPKQRGDLSYPQSLIYDSKIWQEVNNCTIACPTWDTVGNLNSSGGWYLQTAPFGGGGYSNSAISCAVTEYGEFPLIEAYKGFVYYDQNSQAHYFPLLTLYRPSDCQGPDAGLVDTPNAAGYATDGSGYYMKVTNYTDVQLFGPSGTTFGNGIIDRNGNHIDPHGTSFADTRGRTYIQETTGRGSEGGLADVVYLDTPVGEGKSTHYTLNYKWINVSTHFNFTDQFPVVGLPTQNIYVNEVKGQLRVLSSLVLPDGSSYHFGYDDGGYGEMTTMTLPHGGTVEFSYTTLAKGSLSKAKGSALLTPGRLVASHSGADGTTSFDFSYSDSSSYNENGSACGILSVTAANGSSQLTQVASRCNGAIVPRKVVHGSSVSGTYATDYYEYDTTHNCPTFPTETSIQLCAGVQWRNIISKSTVLPSGKSHAVATTTSYGYDHPEQGIPTSRKQWDYYPVSPSATTFSPPGIASREVDETLDYPVNETLFPSYIAKYGSGLLLSSTALSYDTNPLSSAGSVPNHDNSLVTSNRGNITQVTRSGAILHGNSAPTTIQKGYTYDDAGMVVAITDERSHQTTLSYDVTDVLPSTITAPATLLGGGSVSHAVSRTYDPASDVLLTTTDQNSQIATYQYDQFGRNSATRYSMGGTPTTLSSMEYPSFNSTVTHTQQSNTVALDSTEIVDAYGRVTQNTAEGISSETIYDARGRVQSQANAHTATPQQTDGATTYVYDDFGRVHTSTSPTGNVTTYDYLANTLTVTDPLSHQRLYNFDAFGEIVSVSEPDSSNKLTLTTAYNYDGNGNLTRIDQKGGTADSSQWRTRTFTYDGVSRLISQTTPEAGTSTFDYDEAGNLVATHNANGSNNTTTFGYDEDNRLTSKTLASGEVHTYVYDGQDQSGDSYGSGRLTSTTSSSGTKMRYQHDALGRVVSTAYCLPSDCSFNTKVQASYDLQGNLSQLTYPDSRQVTGTYDRQNNLAREDFAAWGQTPVATPLLTNLAYNPGGQVRQATFGNGAQMGATYDPNANISSMVYQVGGTPTVARQYSWDANGSNLRSVQDLAAGRTQSYSYDQLDRIQTMADTGTTANACLVNPPSFPAAAETYTIDAWGNLTQKQGNWSLSSTALANNQLSNRTYDAAGNLTQDSSTGAGSNGYTYRSDGLLSGSNGSTYTYDALGQRVRKDGSTTKEYIYFAGQLLALKDASGNWTDRLYGPSGAFATVSGTQSAVPVYRVGDHLGSMTNLMDASGHLASATSTDAFGQIFTDNSGDAFPFIDLERDAENGTDHTQFRQYSSQQGRWLSPDPYNGSYDLTDPQSLNRYAYLSNRPMNDTDTTGLDGDDDDGGSDFGWWSWSDNSSGYNWAFDYGYSLGSDGIYDLQLNWGGGSPSVAAQNVTDTGGGLDGLQGVLNVVGLFPPLSPIANGLNAGISAYQGDYKTAGIYLAFAASDALLPGASDAIKAIKLLEEAEDVAQLAHSTVEVEAVIGIGEHAGESIPARSSARNFTVGERSEINRIGSETGCHSCGSTTPGTKGNFIPDHQPPTSLNQANDPQQLYPHCLSCSRRQGLAIGRMVKKGMFK